MLWQTLIIAVIFLIALFYIGRMIWQSLRTKNGCGENCKCGVDFSQVEKKMQKN